MNVGIYLRLKSKCEMPMKMFFFSFQENKAIRLVQNILFGEKNSNEYTLTMRIECGKKCSLAAPNIFHKMKHHFFF